MTVSTKVQPETLRAFLTGIVDYAGLFPPAALDMPSAVREYTQHRRGSMAWMLGRFIVDAGRLSELEQAFEALSLSKAMTTPWRVSVLLGADVDRDLQAVTQFNQRHPADTPSGGCIDTVEVKVQSANEIESVAARMETYYEVPATVLATEALEGMVETIHRREGRAKIRTGGLTPESIPSTRRVASFLITCASLDVPFKATAGLHHPLRGPHDLSEAGGNAGGASPEAPRRIATMHGFVNVFMAAILARASIGPPSTSELVSIDELESILLETDAGAFHFDSHEAGWRDRTVTQAELVRHRSHFAMAFGSCSFDEPLEGLQAIGWL